MNPKIGQRWRWQQFEIDLIFEITNVTQDKVYGNVVFVKSGYRDNNSSVDFYPWRFEHGKNTDCTLQYLLGQNKP